MARSPSVAGVSCTRQLAQKRVHVRGVRAIRSERRLQLQKDATRAAGIHAHNTRAKRILPLPVVVPAVCDGAGRSRVKSSSRCSGIVLGGVHSTAIRLATALRSGM
jgi:hypothetical protein